MTAILSNLSIRSRFVIPIAGMAKIVMVSSNGSQEMIKSALDSGAKHLLTKPVERSRVADVVDFVLGEN